MSNAIANGVELGDNEQLNGLYRLSRTREREFPTHHENRFVSQEHFPLWQFQNKKLSGPVERAAVLTVFTRRRFFWVFDARVCKNLTAYSIPVKRRLREPGCNPSDI